MSDSLVLYERRERIAYITLNRPEKLNAVNAALVADMAQAWNEFAQDDEAWVAVVTGAGRAFSAGIDLNEPGDAMMSLPGLGIETWKPIIAAINGYCLGIGLVLVMQCDIRIAAADAQIGYPEARVGVTGGVGAGLIKHMPTTVAMEILFTGNSIGAQRAYEVGFVSKVVPPGDLMTEATAMAETIAANGPLVTRALKELAIRGSYPTLRDSHAMAARIIEMVRSSEDAKEGPKAFLEKRKPQFKAR